MTHYQRALCKNPQKKHLRKIYELFTYVLNNIKYLLVVFHSKCYSLSLIVTSYSMNSAYYALVLCNKILDFIILSNFVISLVFEKICKKFGYLPSKIVRLQNLKQIFLVILRIFHLECHVQTSVKFELVMMVGFVFMKFRKFRSLYRETKSSISIKLKYFYCLSYSLFYRLLLWDKSCLQMFVLYKLLKIV